jgi:hypothetical protein
VLPEVLSKGKQLVADFALMRLGLVRGKMACETIAGGVCFGTIGVLASVGFFHLMCHTFIK